VHSRTAGGPRLWCVRPGSLELVTHWLTSGVASLAVGENSILAPVRNSHCRSTVAQLSHWPTFSAMILDSWRMARCWPRWYGHRPPFSYDGRDNKVGTRRFMAQWHSPFRHFVRACENRTPSLTVLDTTLDRMRFTIVPGVLWQCDERCACPTDRRHGHAAILPHAISSARAATPEQAWVPQVPATCRQRTHER